VIAIVEEEPASEEIAQALLSLHQRPRAEGLGVVVEQIEHQIIAATCIWIRLNEVMPSGRKPHNSPSR